MAIEHWMTTGLLGANGSFQRAAREYAEEYAAMAVADERERADALRSVLRVIVEQDPIELVLDPQWSQRIAKGGLDATR